jgi:hypothetical protein
MAACPEYDQNSIDSTKSAFIRVHLRLIFSSSESLLPSLIALPTIPGAFARLV